MKRVRLPEMMDRPDADPMGLAASLDDLQSVNRWLGGRRSVVRRVLDIAKRTKPSDTAVRVLDIGTGSADLPTALVRTARKLGIPLAVTGVDLHPTTVAYARAETTDEPAITILRGNALDLPFPEDEFEIAMCNTTLHHFDPVDARRALAEMERVARWGIVVTDLARSRSALVGANLLAATVWRSHPITRHDGPASVRAAYTIDELTRIATEVFGEGEQFRIRRERFFRLSLVVDRTSGEGK